MVRRYILVVCIWSPSLAIPGFSGSEEIFSDQLVKTNSRAISLPGWASRQPLLGLSIGFEMA